MDVDLKNLTPEMLKQSLAEFDRMRPLNVVSDDCVGCCSALRKALAKGELADKEQWTCPKCGGTWKPRLVEGVRLWEFQAVFMLWR
jgi:hypothetical protein